MAGSGGSRSARRWTRWLLFLVLAAGVCKIIFLGNLDIGKQSSILATWKSNFYELSLPSGKTNSLGRAGLYFDEVNSSAGTNDPLIKITGDPVDDICEAWLEKEDRFTYYRNFTTEPIWVVGEEKDWNTCSVGCVFTSSLTPERKPDAGFGYGRGGETASVLRSMESSHYYPENDIAVARGKGYNVIMTTSLSSDVPVGYFSWAEYDIMASIQPKTEKALAAAFISNCGAHNFRLQALEQLQKLNVPVDSYGGCHRNRDGRGES